MSAKTRITPEQAASTLVGILREIVLLNEATCAEISVRSHDVGMARGIISHLCQGNDGKVSVHVPDILQDPDVAVWACRFMNRQSDGRDFLKNLLTRTFFWALENGIFEMLPTTRMDRRSPLRDVPDWQRQPSAR